MKRSIEWLPAYFFALWHLRRPPLADADADERARWCRDHCGTFAGRWFALGIGLYLLFTTPFVSSVPIAITGLIGITFGIWHIAWQIIAQKRAGPPHIEPPVPFPRSHNDDEDNPEDDPRDH
ncbi:hypothetical protein [Spiribacter salinus]|jgi:hypothetical protein|uniref:hypothetical protein n=1 Tax=Spiribacter salinus TaxID=1335746 RepID=UPI001C96B3C6|nr:hypothetical protein [Spiribacter salinus]MBY5267787.1 hypothetical protein [Spiribacter salinus]